MPARFGSVAKAYVVGDTQINTSDKFYPSDTIQNPYALNLYILGYDGNGKFSDVNLALKENLRTYLSQYRMLTDALNIKSAFIINLSLDFEVIPKPNFNSNEVILRCIEKLKEVLHNDRMQINGPIDISGLISTLDRLEGVQSIPTLEFKIKNDTTSGYSPNYYDINAAIKNNILYPSLDPCIFEIKYPNKDINGRAIKP